MRVSASRGLAARGLASTATTPTEPKWWERVLGYGTDVYSKYTELQTAIAQGASAAQIAIIQQQLIQAQQNQEYQRTLENRRTFLAAGAVGLTFLGFLAWNSNRPKRRR